MHCQNSNIFFSRTAGQFQPNLAQIILRWREFQVCLSEWPSPFPRRDSYEIAKIYWRNLKIFFSRTAGPISTKFSKKNPWVNGIQVCSNDEPLNSYKVNDECFLLLITIMIIICVYWFELFSQVSDVAYGPLVYTFFYAAMHWIIDRQSVQAVEMAVQKEGSIFILFIIYFHYVQYALLNNCLVSFFLSGFYLRIFIYTSYFGWKVPKVSCNHILFKCSCLLVCSA